MKGKEKRKTNFVRNILTSEGKQRNIFYVADGFTLRDRLSSVFRSSHIVSMPLESMDDTAGEARHNFVTQHVENCQ